MVLLHKLEWQTCGCKYVAPVGFRKETARVVDPQRCNKFDGGDGSGTNLYGHGLTYLSKSCTYTSFNQVVAVCAAHEEDLCIAPDKVGGLHPPSIPGRALQAHSAPGRRNRPSAEPGSASPVGKIKIGKCRH